MNTTSVNPSSATTRMNAISEGKTKIVYECFDDPTKVILAAKDDITAHNKEKHDVIKGKAELSNQTACNVFRFLQECGIKTAFEKQIDSTSFLASRCTMIPLEVVVRREAHGSFLKRSPHLQKGHLFSQLVVEFFLKTEGCTWKNSSIPTDDPYARIAEGKMKLYRPDLPVYAQEPFMTLDDYPCKDKPEYLKEMASIAKKTFLALEKAWHLHSGKLVDFKVEFGIDTHNTLVLADVIDNDSWRVVYDKNYVDKELYRQGTDLTNVFEKYTFVRNKTAQFSLPKQQIIFWRGSEKDAIEPFVESIQKLLPTTVRTELVTISMHKQPVHGFEQLQKLVQEIPNSVVLAFIGRSNGAGPTLSANTHIPVITVPMGWQNTPEDVWSSLRAPSKTPVMTVLDPQNALLAALEILALSNPVIYATLRTDIESRLPA